MSEDKIRTQVEEVNRLKKIHYELGKQQERERILKKWSILKENNKCNEKTYYWGDIAMEFNDFIIKEHLKKLL